MKTKITKIQGNLLSITAMLIILTMVTGCYYYKIQTSNRIMPEELKAFQDNKKYFILHMADTAMHLTDILFKDSSFYGTLSPLTKVHMKYKTEKGKLRYLRYQSIVDSSYINETDILNEVHLFYTGDGLKKTGNNVTGYISSIQKVDVYMKNKGKTRRTWLVPTSITFIFISLFSFLWWNAYG